MKTDSYTVKNLHHIIYFSAKDREILKLYKMGFEDLNTYDEVEEAVREIEQEQLNLLSDNGCADDISEVKNKKVVSQYNKLEAVKELFEDLLDELEEPDSDIDEEEIRWIFQRKTPKKRKKK